MGKMAFVSSPLDRMAKHRTDNGWLSSQMDSQNAKFIQMFGDGVRMAADKPIFTRPAGQHEFIFLGQDDKAAPWFAFSESAEGEMQSLRPLMMSHTVPQEKLSIMAQARWHQSGGWPCGQAVKTQKPFCP